MTPEDMAEIHARAMVHSAPWASPTLRGFIEARGAVVVTRDHGFAIGRVIADEAELLTLAVDPNAQGKGHGRVCLRAFEEAVAEEGANGVFLEVSAKNTPAIGLYQSSGYVETGRRHNYYTAPDGSKSDALMMSKSLAPA